MKKIWEKKPKEQSGGIINKIIAGRNKKAGISLISLVITIIIIIILAAIVMLSSVNTVDSASYAKFAHEISEIQTSTDARRVKNAVNGPGEENHNKGFTKVVIENKPDSFVSFDDDKVTGYWVDLDFIQLKDIKTGREQLEENRVTFGKEDVYVYDYEGKVYYAKGYPDEDGRIHYKIDEAATDPTTQPIITKIEYEVADHKATAIVTVCAQPVYGGYLTVTGNGIVAQKTGEDTYQFEVDKNGLVRVYVKESTGGTASTSISVVGIIEREKYTITYDANGGTGAPESQMVREGFTTQISSVVPIKEDYEFLGWATSQEEADNGDVAFGSGVSHVGNGNLNLYAVWELIMFDVDILTVFDIENQIFTGLEIKPQPTVKDGSKILELDKDYALEYSDNTNVGTATVKVVGMYKYAGTITKTFEIVLDSNTEFMLTADPLSYIYDGTPKTPIVTVKTILNGEEITLDSENYDVEYLNNTNISSESNIPTISVIGKGNYAGISKILEFTIIGQDFSLVPPIITVETPEYTYDGTEKTPGIIVEANGITLQEDVDYDVTYEDNTNAGQATVIVTGKGNYIGTTTEHFTIKPGDLEVTLSDSVFTYDGTPHSVTLNLSGNSVGASVKYGTTSETCTQSESPTFTDAGEHTVYYEISKANYSTRKGSIIVKINQKSIAITPKAQTINYKQTIATGTTQVDINSLINGHTLDSITLSQSVSNAGNGQIIAKDAKILSGSVDVTANYAITYNPGTLTINKIKNEIKVTGKTLTYNLSEQTLAEVSGAQGDVYWAVGTELTSSNYSSAGVKTTIPTKKAAGTYTVYYYVVGNNNYNPMAGSVTAKINAKSISSLTISTVSQQTWSGSALKPTPTLTDGTTTLTNNTDYTLTYSNNNAVGTGTVTATGKGNYTGTKSTTFKIVAKTVTVTLDQQSGSGGTASVTGTYGSAMPSITKPTRTGYTFGGYYTSTNGGGTQYYKADGTSAKNWDKTAATKLYAKWTVNKYTVTLNQQSGTGGTATVTATYGSAMPSITKPTRSGYVFGGYYTSTNGGGTQYYKADGTSARTWDKTAATTLYAKWSAVPSATSYAYTGGVQTYTIPVSGVYKLEVQGAAGLGGYCSSSFGWTNGGNGGESVGYKYFDAGQVIYICVGGAGQEQVGGYNGGGNAGIDSCGGGGATHMALMDGTLASIGKDNLSKVLIVAGGGGGTVYWGAGKYAGNGGAGGGLTGANGNNAAGGTQTSGAGFGQGGTNTASIGVSGGWTVGCGGGGGGLYGGAAGAHSAGNASGGAGGSGYIGGVPEFKYNGTTYTPSTTLGGGPRDGQNGNATISFVQ